MYVQTVWFCARRWNEFYSKSGDCKWWSWRVSFPEELTVKKRKVKLLFKHSRYSRAVAMFMNTVLCASLAVCFLLGVRTVGLGPGDCAFVGIYGDQDWAFCHFLDWNCSWRKRCQRLPCYQLDSVLHSTCHIADLCTFKPSLGVFLPRPGWLCPGAHGGCRRRGAEFDWGVPIEWSFPGLDPRIWFQFHQLQAFGFSILFA